MQGKSYRVKAGDTLSGIAETQLGRAAFWPRIYVYNNRPEVVAATGHRMMDPDKIRAGQLIGLPPPEPVHHPHIRAKLHAGRPHRDQVTRPAIPAPTAPVQPAAGPQAGLPPAPAVPQSAAPASGGAGTAAGGGNASETKVNSFPFKYNLDLLPEQKIEGPNFEATVKYQGSIVIWLDKQIPLVTFTNRGAEAAAKQETDTVLGKLVSQAKISYDATNKRVSFENLLTTQGHGMPPSVVAVGIAADSSNPIPAIRAKFTAPKLEGKLGQHLFIAENITIIIDLRPRADDDDISRRPNPIPAPVPQPVRQRAWYEGTVSFIERHGLEIGAGVIIVAAVASNFVTFGTDTPIDIPAAAAAGGMLRMAGAMAQ